MFSMEEIHSANQDATNGLPSRRPIIEMTIPSVLDKTISPLGILFIYFNARVMLHLAHFFFPLHFPCKVLIRLEIRENEKIKKLEKEYPQKIQIFLRMAYGFCNLFYLLLIYVTIWGISKTPEPPLFLPCIILFAAMETFTMEVV